MIHSVPAAPYPPIALTVDVAPDAPASLTNAATVSEGGRQFSEQHRKRCPAIGPGPDLAVTKTHVGDFSQGTSQLPPPITVSNQGSGPSSGTVLVGDEMGGQFDRPAASGAGWTCSTVGDVVLHAGRSAGRRRKLSAHHDHRGCSNRALPSITNIAAICMAGDVNPANNTASDVTTIVPGADLTVTKTHTGLFQARTTRPCQRLLLHVDRQQRRRRRTAGTVTLTDDIPDGLIATSVTGAGWTCDFSARSATCTRADALAPSELAILR